MIYQKEQIENTQNKFSKAISELQIGKLLRKSNITKNCGISAYEVFQFLLLLVFQGKNLFRFLNSKHKDQAVSKNTYYRFLNESSYNWKKFLLLLSARVISAFDRLTRPERVKVLVLDDSVIARNRSKKVELLARVYDHVEHKFKKGFTLLTLGWSDGYSFVPVGFNLLSSASKSNRYEEMSDNIDHRSNGYKTRKESLLPKTEASILLIKRALEAGICADYVLMDTWFTTEPMIKAVLAEGLDVIGMVKQLKQRYNYKGRNYTLPELQKFVCFDGVRNIFGSLCVTTKNGIPVKIVFVRNRNKKSECLYLLSTDGSLSDSEIVRIYGNRWRIMPISAFYPICRYLKNADKIFKTSCVCIYFRHRKKNIGIYFKPHNRLSISSSSAYLNAISSLKTESALSLSLCIASRFISSVTFA